MAAPTFVTEQETTLDATTPKNVAASIDALVDDILVEVAGVESAASTLGTPTGGTSVTRTLRASEDSGGGTQAEVRAWTAPITSNQTFTPSFNASGGGKFAGTALLFRDTDGVGANASTNNGTGSGAPSLDITTTQDNSAIVVVVADWNAADGASRTWRTVNGTTPTSGNGFERSYIRDSAAVTYYAAYYPDAGTAGTKTVGLSAPSTQRYVICAVEILGTAAATEGPAFQADAFQGNAFQIGPPTQAAGGAISGTATVTFSPQGSLTGSGALAGTSTVTFTPQGNLIGTAPITGTATVTFSPQGALDGLGLITGTSTITFTPQASLTGAGALVGATTVAFTPQGALAGDGALTGTATVTFTPTGALLGSGALVGAATVTFAPTGDLTGAAEGALSGTAQVTFTPQGLLTGDGALAGTATVIFTASGAVGGGGAQEQPGTNDNDPLRRHRRNMALKRRNDEEELERQLKLRPPVSAKPPSTAVTPQPTVVDLQLDPPPAYVDRDVINATLKRRIEEEDDYYSRALLLLAA